MEELSNPVLIMGSDIESTWFRAVEYVFRKGRVIVDAKSVQTKEVLNCITHVSNPSATKVPASVVNRLKQTSYGIALLDELTSLNSTWKPHLRLRKYPASSSASVDQVEHIVGMLNKWPATRRAIASVYYPPYDCPGCLEDELYDLPAIQILDFKLRNGRVNLTCYMRSCEICVWWPVNAIQLTRLLDEIAQQTRNVQCGTVTLVLGSAHIRAGNFDYAKELLNTAKSK